MSALDPAGPFAAAIASLWWVFLWVTAAVYAIVIAFLVAALIRARRERPISGTRRPAHERRAHIAIGAGVALTVLVLVGFTIADFASGRDLHPEVADPLRIRITGHQWWWEIEYDHASPDQRVRTANELHIPVNRPVELVLTSADVIHSFWAPNLHGKKDLIPGHTTRQVLTATRAGRFLGQCAEFCGHQHAHMRLLVVAQPATAFEVWRQQQLQSARTPATPDEMRGQDVFLKSSCGLCHAIQGTQASATVAPDLTHLASRQTIASGVLPNTPEYLASWILDPHRLKPGVRMPSGTVAPRDLPPLVAYLSSLE
jgi:cytochrome c oxidase subunit II